MYLKPLEITIHIYLGKNPIMVGPNKGRTLLAPEYLQNICLFDVPYFQGSFRHISSPSMTL